VKKMSCSQCLESVQLYSIEHPNTGEKDEQVLWVMCDCKGYRLGSLADVNYPKNWKQVKQH